jgi:hypothetical protein
MYDWNEYTSLLLLLHPRAMVRAWVRACVRACVREREDRFNVMQAGVTDHLLGSERVLWCRHLCVAAERPLQCGLHSDLRSQKSIVIDTKRVKCAPRSMRLLQIQRQAHFFITSQVGD